MPPHAKSQISFRRDIRESFDDMAPDYDRLFEDVEDLTHREALSLHLIFKTHGVCTVLDCACGTGIQAIGLAQMGYRVSASDISRRMLARLRQKARVENLNITTRLADFRTLEPWKGQFFDAVVCAGGSLPVVPSKEGMIRALGGMVAVAKRPGAVVVVGLHNYLKLKREGQIFLLRRASGRRGQAEVIFDMRFFGSKRVEVLHSFMRFQEGKWHTKTYMKSYLLVSSEELGDMMKRVGCRSVALLDLYGRPSGDSEWVLAVGET